MIDIAVVDRRSLKNIIVLSGVFFEQDRESPALSGPVNCFPLQLVCKFSQLSCIQFQIVGAQIRFSALDQTENNNKDRQYNSRSLCAFNVVVQ